MVQILPGYLSNERHLDGCRQRTMGGV